MERHYNGMHYFFVKKQLYGDIAGEYSVADKTFLVSSKKIN